MVLIALARVLGLLSRPAPRLAARLALRLTRLTKRRRPPGANVARLPREVDRVRVGDEESVLHRFDQGVAVDAPRALLVHGWNSHAGDWGTLSRSLQAQGVRVYAADMPGHGAASGRSSSLPRFVRALRAIEAAHGPFDVWIGHSMGANAALAAYARRHHEGGGRLVLVSPLVSPRRALQGFARAFGLSATATEIYLQEVERDERMTLDELDGTRIARRVDAPALVIHDADDRMIAAADAQVLARCFNAGRLLLTRGLGHRRILDDGAVVREITAFAGVPAPASSSGPP